MGSRHRVFGSIAALLLLGVSSLCLNEASAYSDKRTKVRAEQQLVSLQRETRTVLLGPASTPARFFTIQSILDRIDRAGQGHASTQAAPVELVLPSTTTMDGEGIMGAAAPSRDEPFGLTGFRAPEGQLWSKWRAVQHAVEEERRTLSACRAAPETCGSEAAKRFLAMLDEAGARTDRAAQIAVVNRVVNSSVRYMSDLAQYGELDRWSSPLETFATGRGDCEDYAIAKYVALREIGFASGDLRVVLVNDTRARQDHAVLAVRQDGRWLILDNRQSFATADGEIRSFVPRFALDDEGVKMLAAPYIARAPQVEAAKLAAADERGLRAGADKQGLHARAATIATSGLGMVPNLM